MYSLADSREKAIGVLSEIAEYRPKRRRWLGISLEHTHFLTVYREVEMDCPAAICAV